MNIFDRIDPNSLENRSGQLWVLALTTIFVLATGLAVMMYTVMFSKPLGISQRTVATLFTSYCVLIPLLLGYLIERQFVIKRLRRRINDEENHISNLQHEIRSNLLETLPGLGHFQDRLAMEYRRASRAEQPLSLIMVGVKPSPALRGSSESNLTALFGEAAKALTRTLRGEDSIYHFGGGVFSILLPRMPISIASVVLERLKEGVRGAVALDQGSAEIQLINYPDSATSARDMEKAVLDFLCSHGTKAISEQPFAISTGLPVEVVTSI